MKEDRGWNPLCPCPGMDWPDTVAEIEELVKHITRSTLGTWDAVGQLSDESLSYDSVIRPLIGIAAYKTNPRVCEAKFLQHCSPDAEIRVASRKAGAAIKQLRRHGRMRSDVFSVVKKYSLLAESQDLTEVERHYVAAVVRDFARSGLQLSTDRRAELEELQIRESDLCRRYNANVGQDQTVLEFSRAELEGMDSYYIDARCTNAAKPDQVYVSLRYPDVMPIMSHCSVDATRQKAAEARETSYENNLELMVELVKVRQRIATLLGFANYAEYACEGSMARHADTAASFLTELEEKLREAGKRDHDRLLAFKERHARNTNQTNDGILYPWDIAFCTSGVAASERGVDENSLRMYFPLSHVLTSTFELYESILGVRITEVPQGEFKSWFPSVRFFSVSDASTRKPVGCFYLDLFPRPGKYAHAAVFFVRKRLGNAIPAAVMLANLHEGAAGGEVLMRHQEVVVFFHELGHAMHGICAEQDYNMTRLSKCPRDFMEVTSQMMENWSWNKTVLSKVSKHVETGAPLPDDLIDLIVANRYTAGAIDTLNNAFLGFLDLELHTNPPKDVAEAQTLIDVLRPRFTSVANPKGWNILRNFCHVTDHYPCAYYSYLWSEVISADIYSSKFSCNDKDISAVGKAFREQVLAPGGVGSAMDIVSHFLGRPFSQDAFLRARSVTL